MVLWDFIGKRFAYKVKTEFIMLKVVFPIFCILGIKNISAQSKKETKVFIEDSVRVAITSRYTDVPLYQRLLMGKNYRKTWNTVVKFPVFYLSKSQFQIDSLGGSKQTTSLYLKDNNNRVWVLRSIDKDVEKGIPGIVRNTPFRGYKQDLISGAYPYAALIVSELAKSINIITPDPVYFFVGDDEALGDYRSLFANTVCMLERRDPTPEGSPTDNTEDITDKIEKGENHKIIQKQFLKARLLDMIVGDWDRHEGQWRWGLIDSGAVNYYYPVPRDRDHALFFASGLVPSLMKLTFEPHLSGFKNKSTGLKRLNKKAVSLDKMFLNKLDHNDWERTIRDVQKKMNDTVIEAAVNKLPSEILLADGVAIKEKLKKRRDGLLINVMDYYNYLFPKK